MEKFLVENNLENERLDKALAKNMPTKSRSYLAKCIKSGLVLVNGNVAKGSQILKKGDVVECEFLKSEPLDLEAKDLNLEIVYEDEDVAVVNKPKGMVVHPAAGNWENTLVSGLLYEIEDLAGINGVVRPGIVHRIDKDTSGLLVIAKNDEAATNLAEQLKNHTCLRRYVALVYGQIEVDKGKINAPIGRDPKDRKKMAVVQTGKAAVTHFTVLKRYAQYTLIECQLETGRTHQIRVHLAFIGHPLVGDKIYGPRRIIGDGGQFLHAKELGFNHPRTGKWLQFDSALPDYFEKFLNNLD